MGGIPSAVTQGFTSVFSGWLFSGGVTLVMGGTIRLLFIHRKVVAPLVGSLFLTFWSTCSLKFLRGVGRRVAIARAGKLADPAGR